MTEKQCGNCGELNPPESNYCSNCRSSEFKNVPPSLAARLAGRTESVRSSAVRISTRRVILASAASGGLYFFYWAYLTWKQLAAETKDTHYPVWHALSLAVPVYGLFRMHAHVRVIRELAERHGIGETMAPGLAVILLIVSSGLDLTSIQITDLGTVIALGILNTLLTTTLIVVAQGGLSRYWYKVWPDGLNNARVGVGEVAIVVLGLILLILVFTAA